MRILIVLLLLLATSFAPYERPYQDTNRPYYYQVDLKHKRAVSQTIVVRPQPEGVETYIIFNTEGLDSIMVLMIADCKDRI